MYHIVRRIAIYLVVVAVIGVPTTLYAMQFNYHGADAFSQIMAGVLAALFLAFTVFVTKVGNNIPRSFVKGCRVLAAVVAVALAASVALAAPHLSSGPRSLAEEQAAVEKGYTDMFSVEDCMLFGSDQTITKRVNDAAHTCDIVIPLNQYSVVVYPDGTQIKLEDFQKIVSADLTTLTLVFPSSGFVRIYLFDDTGARYAARFSDDATLDPSAPHYTALTSRWTA